jgi:FkbM family methyltransferase
MGIESTARAWAHRHGLQKSRAVVSASRAVSKVRYSRAWDSDVSFRGHVFQIGQDLSLYPAVRNGGFEKLELDALLPRVPSDALVWDVGANVGIYAVLLASAARDGHVVAFEPVPASHERLTTNLAKNSVDNVTVNRLALSSSAGTATMAVHADAHGCDHIGAEDPDEAAELIEVETTTGDSYVEAAGLGDPDVVKVDIEGHEPDFLEGAWGMFTRRRPVLMMEVNPTAWNGAGDFQRWQQTLDRLFELYGAGDWFDSDRRTLVTEVDVATLGPHAFTLIFPGSDAA